MRELSTEHARYCLARLGLVAEDIDVAPYEKRADLRARWLSEEYLFEAKSREPHSGWLALRKQAIAEIGASTSRPVEPWNSLASTIEEAYDQLMATPCSKNAFRILWVVAPNLDDSFVIACLEKRLLGTKCLTAVADPNALVMPRMLDCYHYSQNGFERCPHLDGAILSSIEGGRLYLNYYSPNHLRFRTSYLYKKFAEKSAVVDPEIEVEKGNALMLANDFCGPRDGGHQWEYLKQKYSLLTCEAIESQFNSLLVLPSRMLGGT